MRRNRDVEIEFPWQIEAVLAGVAAVASALLVLLGWVFFQLANDSMRAICNSLGAAPPPVFLAPFAWPLCLFAFFAFALRLYVAFRRFLARRLEAF